MLNKLGFDNPNVYEEIRVRARKDPLFRFDWFLKSRTTEEIRRRCNVLLTMISKHVLQELQQELTQKIRNSEENGEALPDGLIARLTNNNDVIGKTRGTRGSAGPARSTVHPIPSGSGSASKKK